MYPGTIARTTPDKPAVIMASTGQTLTYAQLDENSARLARMLHDRGLRRGDVIALLSENNLRFFEFYWAAVRSGLYVTAINRHLSPDEVAYIVSDSGARVLFVSAALRDLAEQVVPMTPHVELRFAFGGPVAGCDSLEDALARTATAPLADEPMGGFMLYSSGTTGRPKGIKPTLPDVQVDDGGDPMVAVGKNVFGVGPDDVYLSPAPLYHAAPLRWCVVIHALGGTVVVMDKFDPERMLADIEKYRATITQVVPTMFVRMLKLPEDSRTRHDVSSVRLAIHAAAPCPVEVKRQMMDWWGPILWEYYGSTEGAGLTFINPTEWLDRPGSVGRSALGIVHVCAESGDELPTGEDGMVYFERDVLPFEYHNDPEKTREAQHPCHPTWTTVGDIGHLDDDGYLYLTDRKAFTIISGGVNIYPQEVEDVLTLHPAVLDVAVIGVPDAEMGEQVKAIVQPVAGVTVTEDLAQELIAFVRDRIAHYKAPRSVDFSEALPRTPTGKLVKRELQQRYASTART